MSPLDAGGLRARREKLELSQRELSRQSGIRQATLSRLENGTLTRVTLDHIERLAAALGCEPAELLTVKRKRGR